MIDTLIAEALEQRQKEAAVFQAQQETEQQQKVEQLSQQAQEGLIALFGDLAGAIFDAFQMQVGVFSLHRDGSGIIGATFTDPETDQKWRLERNLNPFSDSAVWHLYDNAPNRRGAGSVSVETVLDFFVAIGNSREAYRAEQRKLEEEEKALAEKQRQQELRDAERKAAQEKRDAENREKAQQADAAAAKLLAEAQAEHERCMDMVNQRKETLLQTRWTMNAAQVLTVYKVRWLCGHSGNACGCGEYHEDPQFDYQEGWSLVDALDERGYVYLVPTRWGKEPRAVKLVEELHLPTFERFIYTADTLPTEFTEMVEFTVQGVAWKNNLRHFDERYLERKEEGSATFELGVFPMGWVAGAVK